MPGKHVESALDEPCRRCKENVAALVVRSEPLCRECFIKYVHTKVVKRMETFRVRYSAEDQQRKLLLALSFGPSSISLLHILDDQLKTQIRKTGRTGFSLSIVLVQSYQSGTPEPSQDLLERVRNTYPGYELASLPLHNVFGFKSSDSDLSTLMPLSTEEEVREPRDKLCALLSSLTSATARSDVLSKLQTRLIVEHAKSMGCEGILWGDSTTKLAEKTLAETAKGRGFTLPWQISDGQSPSGIAFYYPLRDVLKKELASYIGLVGPPLSDLVLKDPERPTTAASSKHATIDDLMKQYFESVEENFPSIVSNVVRTASKLNNVPRSDSCDRCDLCNLPVADGRFGIHGWGGDQDDSHTPSSPGGTRNLCYGCSRSVPTSMPPR